MSLHSLKMIIGQIRFNDVNEKWNFQSKPFGLPESFRMGLGDISAGSSTPSMVRKVKAWLKLSIKISRKRRPANDEMVRNDLLEV